MCVKSRVFPHDTVIDMGAEIGRLVDQQYGGGQMSSCRIVVSSMLLNPTTGSTAIEGNLLSELAQNHITTRKRLSFI